MTNPEPDLSQLDADMLRELLAHSRREVAVMKRLVEKLTHEMAVLKRLRFTSAYLDSLFEPGNYDNLIQITSLLTGSSAFDSSKSDFGLGDDLFALVESLGWFAQSVRSGSWTYFETTPSSRQARMLGVLRISGPPGFSAKYEYGMTHWRDAERLNDLDLWIDGADGANNDWLWALAALRRREILAIIT